MAIPESKRPNCCSRNAFLVKRSCPSRVLPRASSGTTPASVYAVRRFRSPHTRSPHTQFLSNGRYTVGLDACRRRVQHLAGTGRHASARGSDVRRGIASHLSSRSVVGTGLVAHLPARLPRARRATKRPSISTRSRSARRDGDFETQLQVSVSSEDDVEVRRLSIINRGIAAARNRSHQLRRDRPGTSRRRFRAPGVRQAVHRNRIRHRKAPACCSAGGRARPTKSPIWAFTCSASRDAWAAPSNGRPTGRASSAADARRPTRWPSTAARCRAPPARCSTRLRALRERVRLAPGAVVRVTFATGVAPRPRRRARAGAQVSRRQRRRARLLDGLHARAHHAAAPGTDRRSRDPVRSPGVARLRSGRVVHQPGRSCAATRSDSRTLWGYGISGDLPIVLVRVTDAEALPLVRQLLLAQEYWRVKGLRADVVILNEHPADYLDETQNSLTTLVQEPPWARLEQPSGGMFLLRADGMPEADRRLLSAVARVVLRGDLGDLASQLDASGAVARRRTTTSRRSAVLSPPPRRADADAVPAAGHGERPRRLHAAMAATTSSCSMATARRRCRGRT